MQADSSYPSVFFNRKPPGQPEASPWALHGFVLGLQFVLCLFGSYWIGAADFSSPVWPAAGFALVVGLQFGWRLTAGLFLGKLLALLIVGQSWPLALLSSLGDPLKALVAAWVLKRLAYEVLAPGLRSLGVLILGCLSLAFAGAVLGLCSLSAYGLPVRGMTGFIWFSGDFLGAIACAPLMFLLKDEWLALFRDTTRLGKLLAFVVIVVGLSAVLFTDGRTALSAGFILIPVLGWAATLLCLEGVLVLNAVFVFSALLFLGPLANQHTLFVAALFGVGVINSLTVASATAERRLRDKENAVGIERLQKANTALQDHQRQLEGILCNLPDAVVIPDGGRIVFSNKAAGILAAELCIVRGTDRPPWDFLSKGDHSSPEAASRSFVHTESMEDRGVLHFEVQVSPIVWQGRNLQLYVIHDFSEHQALAQEAWSMHARFERIFQLSPNPITLTSFADGLVLEANDAFVALSGCTRDELSSRTLLDLGFWPSREARQAFLGRLRSHSQVDRLELSYVDRHGRSCQLFLTARIISNSGEECILTVFDDLTERRITQNHLRESQDRYRLLVENIQDLVLELDDAGVIQYASPNYTQLHGYRPEQVLGKRLDSFLTPGSATEWNRFVDEGQHGQHILELVAADQTERTVQSFSNWCVLPSGRRTLIVTLRDISEQRMLERRVRDSQLRFAKLFQLSPNAIALSRFTTGEVIEVNEAFLTLFCCSREMVVGRTTVELSLFNNKERRNELLGRLKSEHDAQILQHESEIKRPDGARLIVSLNIRRMRIGDEDLLLSVLENISERRKLEAQLRQSQKLEAIGTLAGGIAHDFNNVLTAIIGNAELALMDLPPGNEVSASLRNILSASGRARDLVSQILTFSRKKEQQRILASVTPIIQETCKLIRATLPANITVLPHIPGEGAKVFCDVSQVHQILMNLCTNAAYAMKVNGGVLTLREDLVEADAVMCAAIPKLKPGPYVHISVRDTGCGMSEDTLSRIFEPFFTTKPQGEGTGLGLAVVHGIVDAHGGAMSVFSRVGQGTVFNIYIPVAFGAAGVAVRKDQADVPRGKGQRILVVDDEQIVLDMLTRMLSRLGYSCDAFSNPTDAAKHFQEHSQAYSLVISDHSMPSMSGIQLAQRIYRSKPGQAFLLMSGFLAPHEQEQARSVGVSSVIDKPLNYQAVAETVVKVLA